MTGGYGTHEVLPLFAERLPHNRTATSRAAAEGARPYAGRQAQQVLAAVRNEPGGLTREEIAERTGIRLAAVCARVNALVRAGLAVENGTRTTSGGRQAKVVLAAAR